MTNKATLHTFFEAKKTGLARTQLPFNTLNALVYGEPNSMRWPLVVATGLYDDDEKVLQRMARILNAHWHDPMYDTEVAKGVEP
jgi:hypothetical protein